MQNVDPPATEVKIPEISPEEEIMLEFVWKDLQPIYLDDPGPFDITVRP